MTNSLAARYPAIASEWHSTLNEELSPETVLAGSKQRVWWQCPQVASHVWAASVQHRTGRGSGCPLCSGRRVAAESSLSAMRPDIAAQWHPSKNGDLTPDQVVWRSKRRVWWRCALGADHEWQTNVRVRTVDGTGCPFCSNRRLSAANSLAVVAPKVAQEWHPAKNGGVSPDQVLAGSFDKAWWKCPKGLDHEWQATIRERAIKGAGCPHCRGLYVSTTNSLSTRFPAIAAEWHPTLNGELRPQDVVSGSHRRAWWQCQADHSHVWEAKIQSRTSQDLGCPYCAGRRASATNSLASRFPEIASQWHSTKNGDLTASDVTSSSHRKVWWTCPHGDDHEWQSTVANRTSGGAGCPYCIGRAVSGSNSLAATNPAIAAQWHPTKNGSLTANDVTAGSNRAVWWLCNAGPDHAWRAAVVSRTTQGQGCPRCNQGWTIQAIRGFIESLRPHLPALTPAERYLLFQQSGLFDSYGKGKPFVKALATGRFPLDEVDKFITGAPSIVDQFINGTALTPEGQQVRDDMDPDVMSVVPGQSPAETSDGTNAAMPMVGVGDVLRSLDSHACSAADTEAVEFLLASALAKLWRAAYHDDAAAVAQAEAFHGGDYAERVRRRFLDEVAQARGLLLPEGYAFQVGGSITPPNLMQRHFVSRVLSNRRVGNWSGTGAGKTLSAVLASRVADAGLTVICCPNSVVDGWRRAILDIYPDSAAETKTFTPRWSAGATHRYLVLNYEAFQQADSAARVRDFTEREPIDFLVVDEIHYTKQRTVENLSQRRQLVTALASLAAEKNPDLHVIGMSATPVINNLLEGKSLIELVSGVEHNDLEVTPTVANCMRMHQRLVTLGIRWMPEYALGYEQQEVQVDCGEFLDEIRQLGKGGTPLALEQILTRARLPAILSNVQRKTLIYTQYVQGIDRILRDALEAAGWRTGFYTGDDKSGLDAFIDGDLDVLIGSSAIGTGVDGLQRVCNRLIVNVLPWTAAEFEQLKGRIFRQGQRHDTVTMVLPLTFGIVNGQRWSWCESKMQRLRFKKSIADAAVDGVVPEGHLRAPAQAYQDAMAWLARLEEGVIEPVDRRQIVVPLPDSDPKDVARRHRRYGDFSKLNGAWNHALSDTTHKRLARNPEEWEQYHTLYRAARRDWAAVPFEEMIRWGQQRSGYAIGDFGCGEALLGRALADRHTVYSVDHVAVDDTVTACDMAHVPLDDETLDLAIFCLSLMGSNFADYLAEAHRTLKLDGQLHIWEATSRFGDRETFAKDVTRLGFDLVKIEDKWKFTHLQFLKADRRPEVQVELAF